MDYQIAESDSPISKIKEKRGDNYPTRKDTIVTSEDRGDWIEIARDIMTKSGTKPDSVSKIAGAGSIRNEVLRSFLPKKPQRSLWNILIGIIQSTQKETIIAPTVSQLDALFEELAPSKPSLALAQFGSPQIRQEPTVWSIIPRVSKGASRLLVPTSDLAPTQDIQNDFQERTREILSNSVKNNLQILPDITHIMGIPKTSREDLWAFYGYKGAPHDPTLADSYDEKRRKTYDDIASIRGAKKTAVCVSVSLGCKRLRELSHVEGEGVDSSTKLSPPIIISSDSSQISMPKRFEKRRMPTPIPKNIAPIQPNYTGETKQTSLGARGARVVQPPRDISKSAISFQELVVQSPEGRIIPKKTPEAPKKPPFTVKDVREIPDFISYRAAIEWGQKQEDWLWCINLWKNSTPPLRRDDLSVLAFLRESKHSQLQVFLNTVRTLVGNPRLKYTSIFETLSSPLLEEKIGITDIQENAHWMGMIQDVFTQHESRQYADVMVQLSNILSDELLGGAIFDSMPEYGVSDHMDILALIAGKNWTPEDSKHYMSHTMKDAFQYKKGSHADLEKVFAAGRHVKQKMLEETLKGVILKVPLGEKQWPRYREYDTPEVTLYDVVTACIKKEGGDTESSKALFNKLDELIR